MTAPSTRICFVEFGGPRRGLTGQAEVRWPEGKGGFGWHGDPDDAIVDEAPLPAGRMMAETFSRREVSRLFELGEGRLEYWDRSGFLSPTGHDGRRRCYTFQDLIRIRSARDLLEAGVSLRRVRRAIDGLSEQLPRSTHPLGRLRIRGDGRTVVVVEDDHEFEADSGQLLLDFSVSSLEEAIVKELPARTIGTEARSAYEWYLEGCRLDEDESSSPQAEEAYHRAIHLDPGLANAYTNLGNLRFRAGATEDAKALYEKAIEVDPDQPEAYYNMGYIWYEDGQLGQALDSFIRSIEIDPTFADAHFNLAMTLFQLRRGDEARAHWRRYLSIEPSGPWAEIARRRLREGQ
ncbi:MAG TPA: tetratricopeptide repeat protein [Polyangia bacterium]|nr:tetratricopeptide repeat protein [Polyangia bacterium]